MNYTQIISEQDCILRIVYSWNPDEEDIGEVISIDLEEGNVATIMDEGIYEDIIEQIYNLHNEELSDP